MLLKQWRGRIPILYLYGSFIAIMVVLFTISQSVSANPANLKIETNPADTLFDSKNLAPGNQEIRTLKVINADTTRFSYSLTARKVSGSDILFNKLQLKVEGNGVVLVDSSLGNIAKIAMGELGVGETQEFTFTITFPFDAGNEYQGLAAAVDFDFVATAIITPPIDPPDDDPPIDPPKDDDPPIDPPKDGDPPTDNDPITPQEDDSESKEIITLDDPEEPLGLDEYDILDQTALPEQTLPGIELPKTSSPWYNLLLFSSIIAVISGLLLWATIRMSRSQK